MSENISRKTYALSAAGISALLVAAFALLSGGQRAATLGLTAHGDILYATDGGAADVVIATRLPAGSAGYILRSIGGTPTWRELSSSGTLASRPACAAGREGQEHWATDGATGLQRTRCVHQGAGTYAWTYVAYDVTAAGSAIARTDVSAAPDGGVLTVAGGVPQWAASAGGLPSGTGLVTVSSGTGGVLAAATTGAGDLLDALRSSTLSVSSTNAAAGTAAGTATTISLTIPTGASVTTTRSDEPSVVLASTGAITRCEVVVRLATVTNSTATQGLALTIGDNGGSGTLGAGAVLGFRIATNGASDAIRDGSTVVWSNYSAGALTLDGDTWLRMVVGRTGTGAVFTGRGSSRAAVAWTRRWTGDLSTALADNARANVRAAIYVSSGTVPTDITADITSITWTDL